MAIKISTVFILLGVPAVLAQNNHIGYDYRAPAVPVQLPSSNLGPNYNLQQYYYNNAPQTQNGFLPSPSYHQHYAGDYYRNQESQIQQTSNYNNQEYQSAQLSYQNENYNSYNQNFGNGQLLGAQNAIQNVRASTAYNPSYSIIQPQQPVITKHIYFHLPPEEDSAPATPVPPPARKKTYNIIFIKLPSQKSSSATQLQQIINQQAAVGSKTLIYVLVKKPETRPIQPVTSKPEVFYVKYKEPRNVAQPVNSGLVQVQLPQVSSSGLLPGQINGHGEK